MSTPTVARAAEVTVFTLTAQSPTWSNERVDVAATTSVEGCLSQLGYDGPSLVLVDTALLSDADSEWVGTVEALLGPVVALADDAEERQVARELGIGTTLPRSLLAAEGELAASVLSSLAGSARPTRDDLERYMRDALHEFRTPLTTIIEFASLLEDGIAGPLEQRQRSYVERLMTASHRLVEQLDDYRDGLRLRLGSLSPRPSWCSVGDLLEVAAQAVGAKHEAILHVEDDAARAWTDPKLAAIALDRIVVNARRAALPESPFHLAARADGEDLVVTVAYDGAPPSAMDCRLMEEKWVQHDGYYRSVTRVFGVGVALADRFAKATGGRLELAAGAVSGGVYTLRLPLKPHTR